MKSVFGQSFRPGDLAETTNKVGVSLWGRALLASLPEPLRVSAWR
jgi:hypothetical protein